MRHYPVFMDLRARPVLVVGRGEAAARKAEAVAGAGAILRLAERFDASLLPGCALALGADAPEQDLQALSEAAIRAGIPVNIVDRPELSSFITPAIIDRDPVTIAVGTAGTAPVLARLLREKIEALIPPAYGRLAALAERFRADIRRCLPDIAQRRRVLERLFTGPVAALAFAGRDERAAAEFARTLAQPSQSPTGMVFLVGAGPGAGDLLTIRAQRLLGEADVIVHDRLVTDEILDLARRDAPRIFVGKARANHCMTQTDINALLIRLAREGKKVIRLKGGDPFIFGRGGEEAEALAEAGIPFQVVPGVTAALACAAQAGIPLTHRDTARLLIITTGHTSHGTLDLDFPALVRARTTLAIYMGLTSLPLLRNGLLAHGLDPATPAALIERGGTTAQRERYGTLDDLAAAAPEWSSGGPILILVGPVVHCAASRCGVLTKS